MRAHARLATLGLALTASASIGSLTSIVSLAHADDEIVPWTDCDDCGTRDWILGEPGAGPELGPLARLELGTAGLAVDDDRGGHLVTAGVARVRLAVGLTRTVGVRGSASVQVLGVREAPFPIVAGATASGTFALGLSKRLGTVSYGKLPVAVTLDGELSQGLAVRSGLALRSLTDGRLITIAPGLATAFDFDVGTVRAHARYLHTRADAASTDGDPTRAIAGSTSATTGALELGLGASMRINWRSDFWGGSWPLEPWLDLRHRRALAGDARELAVRGGLDYLPARFLDRVGVEVAATSDHLAGGQAAHGLAMLLTLQYGRGE